MRALLILFGAGMLGVVVLLALPLADLDWTRGLVLLLFIAVAVDVILAGIRKRWPRLLDLVMAAT